MTDPGWAHHRSRSPAPIVGRARGGRLRRDAGDRGAISTPIPAQARRWPGGRSPGSAPRRTDPASGAPSCPGSAVDPRAAPPAPTPYGTVALPRAGSPGRSRSWSPGMSGCSYTRAAQS